MEKRSVLICEYCGKVIDQDDKFIHDIERDGDEIQHDGYYHQECFINSMIKDLEELGFEIIRPRSEFHEKRDDKGILDLTDPNFFNSVMNMAKPLISSLTAKEIEKYQEEKKKAFDKLDQDHDKKKREEKKQTVRKGKKK